MESVGNLELYFDVVNYDGVWFIVKTNHLQTAQRFSKLSFPHIPVFSQWIYKIRADDSFVENMQHVFYTSKCWSQFQFNKDLKDLLDET